MVVIGYKLEQSWVSRCSICDASTAYLGIPINQSCQAITYLFTSHAKERGYGTIITKNVNNIMYLLYTCHLTLEFTKWCFKTLRNFLNLPGKPYDYHHDYFWCFNVNLRLLTFQKSNWQDNHDHFAKLKLPRTHTSFDFLDHRQF